MKMPNDIGQVHFVGIGGIGMSGIAEVLHNLGYRVQGSDLVENPNVQRLQDMGISVAIGHHADHIQNVDVLVVSSAIQADNAELKEARSRHLPIVRRAEMLAEVMRFKSSIAIGGTHGKTTTTSLVATLLDAAHFDPTVINGGIINAYGTNARLGEGDWMVVEADESDGTFVKLPADVAIVTNIDPEHLDYYGSFDNAREAFRQFIENVPFYGFAVMCIDHAEVQGLIGRIEDRRIVTYGQSPQADARCVDICFEGAVSKFAVEMRDRISGAIRRIENLELPMPGLYNVLNATAAITTADQLGISERIIRQGLSGFSGVKRRFTRTGEWNGISVFDDYAHHPVEISAVLKAARSATEGNVIAIMQPHRYTRLRDLFEGFCTCFNDADTVVVAPVFSAGETVIEGYEGEDLAEGLRARGHRNVLTVTGDEDLPALIADMAQSGDIVICLGAGSITKWAYALPHALEIVSGR